MDDYFKGNSYQTAGDCKRFLLDSLLLKSRWAFYISTAKWIRWCANQCKDDFLSNENFMKAAIGIMGCVEGVGGTVGVKGFENVAALKGQPTVFIGNHMSLLETLILPALIIDKQGNRTTFVIKQALLDYLWMGQILKSINSIAVGRDNPREDLKMVMAEGQKRLENGYSVVIFPQATRSAIFEPENFNSIGIKLAKRAKVPVVPFALKTDFLENGKLVKDLGTIRREKKLHFEFDKALEVTGNGKEQHQYIIDFIKGRLAEWSQ